MRYIPAEAKVRMGYQLRVVRGFFKKLSGSQNKVTITAIYADHVLEALEREHVQRTLFRTEKLATTNALVQQTSRDRVRTAKYWYIVIRPLLDVKETQLLDDISKV